MLFRLGPLAPAEKPSVLLPGIQLQRRQGSVLQQGNFHLANVGLDEEFKLLKIAHL